MVAASPARPEGPLAQYNEPQNDASRLPGVGAEALRVVVPGYDDYTAWADWARLRVGARAGLV